MRSDQEALELVRAKAAGLRRRRTTKAITGGAVGLAFAVFVALAARPSDDQSLHLSGDGPDRRPLSADGRSTSETTSSTEVSSKRSATDEPRGADPTVQAPAPLRIEAVLLDERPLIDGDLHFRVTITDGDGSPTRLSVKAGVHLDQPDPSTIIAGVNVKMDFGSFPPCGEPGPSSTTLDVAVPYSGYDYMSQAYGRTGDYWVPLSLGAPPTIAASFTAVSSTGCADEGEETAVSAPVTIRLGFGNGPAAPEIVLMEHDRYPESPPGPTGGLGSDDCDGVLDRLEVDWGDGTGTQRVPLRQYGCVFGVWRTYLEPQHEYAVPGTYTITVVAVSVDDRGELEQRSEPSTIEYTAT